MHEHDPLTERIIGCGITVHRVLGPGLPEPTYEEAMCIELTESGLSYARQVGVPIHYKGRIIGEYRPDLVVAGHVVVEIKSVERLAGVHSAQVLAYMRILRVPVGLLLNFYGEMLRTGVKRLVL